MGDHIVGCGRHGTEASAFETFVCDGSVAQGRWTTFGKPEAGLYGTSNLAAWKWRWGKFRDFSVNLTEPLERLCSIQCMNLNELDRCLKLMCCFLRTSWPHGKSLMSLHKHLTRCWRRHVRLGKDTCRYLQYLEVTTCLANVSGFSSEF